LWKASALCGSVEDDRERQMARTNMSESLTRGELSPADAGEWKDEMSDTKALDELFFEVEKHAIMRGHALLLLKASEELAALRAGYARLESENEELFGAVAGVLADAEHKSYTTKGTKELCHHAAKNWIAARKDLKK